MMLSRTADSLFWLSRYMERADGLIRMTRTQYINELDNRHTPAQCWAPVTEVFAPQGRRVLEAMSFKTDAVLNYLLFDPANNNALKILLTRARENARGVQDHITKEVWEHVNQLYHIIQQYPAAAMPENPLELLDELTRESLMYYGVTDITMPRGAGWCFISLGRYIERCLQTIAIVNTAFKDTTLAWREEQDVLQWRSMLLTLSGYELHLKNYSGPEHTQNVLHQIIYNENFTRSVLYGLSRIGKYMQDISDEKNSETKALLGRIYGSALSMVKYRDPHFESEASLFVFLNEIQHAINELSSSIGNQFFHNA